MCKVVPTSSPNNKSAHLWPFPSRNRVTIDSSSHSPRAIQQSLTDRCAFLDRRVRCTRLVERYTKGHIATKTLAPLFYLSLIITYSEMAISKASIVALVAVIVSVVATVASAQVEAPAPSPTSGSVAISASVVSAGVAAVAALVFGSALRI
ncbi:unnamed protein product [Microthlaspi erraticum]|uniref:Uncharacterized protein n=1 Tax=Microthlaspi erraticum TaxID=1685480 RepID=A0A6D2JT05_9BRAS|nr:unnamed protein product [Microthlaspi erraticum]